VAPDIEAWDAWHPRAVADRLAGVGVPWYVAAGWAVDLFRGGRPRAHEDLEIAVPAAGFAAVAARFPELEFWVPGDRVVTPVPRRMAEHHQTWAYDPVGRAWRFDVFREPHDGDTWICRRDERIRLPYGELVRWTADGIPYLRPDVALLFKAKAARGKDEADLAGALPLLSPAERAWLAGALARVHPGHPWLARIG
jgi:hypothetical protein